jgi:hypothetical protein
MSDATDAVAEAKARTKQLAARRLVRKQELEDELAQLERDHPGDERTVAMRTELAAATQEYQAALAELASLDRLGEQARHLEARAAIAAATEDPFERSAEQIALDNVREHAADLEAQVKLNEELDKDGPPTVPVRPGKKTL